MIKIIGELCNNLRLKHVEYSGKLSHNARSKNILKFGDPTKRINVMIASLKAGGIGLNMVMANRCLMVDSWWLVQHIYPLY